MKILHAILLTGLIILVNSCETADEIIANPAITTEEANDLIFLREEEKLAYDVYIYAFEQYGLTIFNNISKSEQSHTNAVLELLDKYNLNDPVGSNAPGVFDNEDLQAIYDALTAKVKVSEAAALEVGATIEDLDINDIALMQKNTINPDLVALYANLICGSRNHLRAFTSWMEAVYTPQFISPEEFQEIIKSDREQCGN